MKPKPKKLGPRLVERTTEEERTAEYFNNLEELRHPATRLAVAAMLYARTENDVEKGRLDCGDGLSLRDEHFNDFWYEAMTHFGQEVIRAIQKIEEDLERGR